VYEGAFRILRALGEGSTLTLPSLVRQSGEARSVVREVLNRYPNWFEQGDEGLKCTERGLAALARELVARGAARPKTEAWIDAYDRVAAARGPAKAQLDQVYATTSSIARRAELLLDAGEHQRGLVFLGDDDLTSAAVQLAGAGRRTTVLDTDRDILDLLDRVAEEHGFDHVSIEHDLREPVPRALHGRFGAVFTDPPYALEGFRLFISRAVSLLKPDGRLYVCFGHSRRAAERGLQKQRVLCDAGFAVEAVFEDFNHYHGAESIGARSALWKCVVTPETRSLVSGSQEGPIYSSR
jgi:predicted methyltransferase